VLEFCDLSAEGMTKYRELVDANSLSTRSMDRLAKVARTVADLEGARQVQAFHLSKASHYVVGGLLRDSF
jgi:magnesium chelatase family protein